MKNYNLTIIKCLMLLSACAFVEVPGETKNSPEIANFAAKQIFSTLKSDVPGCNDGKVLNTVFDGYISTTNNNSWYETWTIDMCGKRFAAQIEFYTPEGRANDTTVSIAGRRIKPLN